MYLTFVYFVQLYITITITYWWIKIIIKILFFKTRQKFIFIIVLITKIDGIHLSNEFILMMECCLL